jgi:HAMP domain-containing protein
MASVTGWWAAMLRHALALPLRLRVTLLYIALGLVMSVLFAAMMTFIAERYEGVLVGEILSSQAGDYAERLRNEPDAILPRSSRLSGYVRRKDGSGEVPDALAALPPGVHESVHEDEDGMHMAVFDTAVGRLYFVINLSDIERLEGYMHAVLAAVVVFGTLVSAWLGWLLSGGVVRPVRRLADAVEGLSTVPAHTELAATLPRDELGRLGKAIDDYQARLVAAQEAERAFFADASHELRTPIAVVHGATELLIEDGAHLPALQPRLQRLERGVRQLSELLDALLGLARRRVGASETVVLRGWVRDCLAVSDAARDGYLQPQVEGRGDPVRALPVREAALVLNGIVRRLVPAGAHGRLLADVGDGEITLRFVAANVAADAGSVAISGGSDRGFGMTLIGRLATQIGWQLEEDAAQRYVRIHLPPDAPGTDAGARAA